MNFCFSDEGRLDLHGALFHPTWTRLAAHIPGANLETNAPEIRNKILYVQDCVNWVAGQIVLVTTTHHKDTRGYNFNEEKVIENVQCVTINEKQFGKIILVTSLQHYHHAGHHEYQAEVLYIFIIFFFSVFVLH
jgi:hypothetical protein